MIKGQLKVYNTYSGKKEDFEPIHEGKVGMYVCGPTTYNYIHLGNARPIVVFDTVRRYLEYLGYDVMYIQNFTDVDDKIIKKAQEEKEAPLELAARYIREYYADADKLNVKRATVHPKVSEHMNEIIGFVQGLVDKGYAYSIEGDVYFGVRRFDNYGRLSKRTLEDLQAGARVEVDTRKEHPGDFALWKRVKPGEPAWESPWGLGRPGWHIECSAMSHKYLGPTFDIHAGGYDLVFPHHENEIAQSEAFYGSPMAKYWIHNGFITVNEEKMSKSLGNFFLLRDILKKFPGEVIRFYLLSTHYRSPLDFDDKKLGDAQKGLERLQNAYRLWKEAMVKLELLLNNQSDNSLSEGVDTSFGEEIRKLHQRFLDAMDDDFNTALAIAVLFDFARTINTHLAKGISGKDQGDAVERAGSIFRVLASILGINLEKESEQGSSDLLNEIMELLLDIRSEARLKKDFVTADTIRDRLKELGIILEDTPQGVRWRL